jgi:hypothetical protein
MGDIAEGKGNEIARADFPTPVNVQMGQSGPTAKGFGRFEVEKTGKDWKALITSDFPLILQDAILLARCEDHVPLP